MLKQMRGEHRQSALDLDSRFVSYMLALVFDTETLKRSSANGRIANNVGIGHAPLDPVRLKFMKGTSSRNDID